MSKKKAKRKVEPPPGSYVFFSIAPGGSTRSFLSKAGWVVKRILPPHFWKITIENGQVTDNYYCHAGRGTFGWVPDRVSWVNRDGEKRVIKFLNNRSPLEGKVLEIEIGPYQGSSWYALDRASGGFGQSVSYEYKVDDRTGGPDGPSIISED